MYVIEGNIYINTQEFQGFILELKSYSRSEVAARTAIKDFKRILTKNNKIWKGKISLGSRYINENGESGNGNGNGGLHAFSNAHSSF